MNYFGLKRLTNFYVTSIHDKELCKTKVALYDCLSCANIGKRVEGGCYFGLFTNKEDLFQDYLTTGVLFYFKDPILYFARVCQKYLLLEPTYMALTSGGKCNQIKESFDEWISTRIRHLVLENASNFRLTGSVDCTSPHNVNVSERKINKMLDYFMKLPSEVMYHPTLSTKISLPMFGNTIDLDSISREWLLFITWYRKVANELEPILNAAKFEKANEIKKNNLIEKLNGVLCECQSLKQILFKSDVYDKKLGTNYDLVNIFPSHFLSLLDIDISDLRALIVTDPKTILLKAILKTCVNAANEAVTYIVDLQSHVKKSQKALIFSQTLTKETVHQFHNILRRHFMKKIRIFSHFNENQLKNLILQTIGNLLKIYFWDYPTIDKKIELSQYRQNLERMQHLILDMISEVGFTLIDTADEFYKVKVEGLEKMLRQISILLSGVVILEHLQKSKFVRNAELVNELNESLKLVQEKTSSIPCFLDVTEDLQNTMRKMMSHCISLIAQRREERDMTKIPASVFYERFGLYFSCYSNSFAVCPHPLLDLNELTDGKLYKFMSESLMAFEKQKRSFDLILQLAERYVRCQ